MFSDWVTSRWQEVPMVVLSGIVIYVTILAFTRIAGLRSFSKMSASDFAMTVAVGSLFGSVISSPEPSLVLGVTAFATLFAGQWLFALCRSRLGAIGNYVDNEPLLLMHGRTILEENLRRSNVTRADLYGKLREANAYDSANILAVVFETTGDISVLHSNDPNAKLDPKIVEDVLGSAELTSSNEIAQEENNLRSTS